jgi:hypothetical protein
MVRARRVMSLVILLLVVSTPIAAPAVAAVGPTPITISTQVSFVGPPHGTFAATPPLCPSGTFSDAIVVVSRAPRGFPLSILAERTLTCDDGSGAFFVQLHAQFLPNGAPGTASGPWTATGGSGAYSNLHGAGTFVVTVSPISPTGTETLTGFVVLP